MIKPYIPDDHAPLTSMLLAEGLNHDDMGFATGDTYVYDDNGIVKGFYTYKMDGEFPYLVHFCTHKSHRSLGLALSLIRDFRGRIKKLGYNKGIINCPKNDYIRKMIEWYTKTKPYAKENQHGFYLIGA